MRINRKRRWLMVMGVFVMVFLAVLAGARSGDRDAEAASLADFDAGYIISDWQMGNYTSMSEADIQAFLTAKNSCGNRDYGYYLALSANTSYKWHWADGHFVCLSEERFGDGEVIGSGDTAAHIIWQAAQDYKINPQVLLVLLQKETSLITDPIPNDGDYRKATGYGCPDTAPCSSEYYGFKNQIRKAAALFRTVLDGGWTNYPLGNNYVQYNPNPDCGGSVVNIRSLATSALYRYTPYQPNAGALAAGYGTAECGAYGNRNFYLYFQDWFGGIRDDYAIKFGQTLPDGSYQIFSTEYNHEALDVSGGVTEKMDEADLILYTKKSIKNLAENQKFEVVFDMQSGYYNIYNKVSELYLTNSFTKLVLIGKNGTCGQNWNLERLDDGYFYIVSACDGRILTIDSEKNVVLGLERRSEWQFFEVSKGSHLLKDGTYQIVSGLSDDYVIDIKGGVSQNMKSGSLNLWKKKVAGYDLSNQTFDVVYDEETGYYTISNTSTGLALDVYGGIKSDGTKVIVWPQKRTCNQQWLIRANGNSGYEIISACTGKAIDVSGGLARNGKELIIYSRHGGKNQQWSFTELPEPEVFDGEYVIVSRQNEEFVLDISGGVNRNTKSGQLIVYKQIDGGKVNQTFKIRKDAESEFFYIYNPESNLYLDVYNGERRDGVNIIMWPYNGGCNQKWRIVNVENKYYSIFSACSEKSLDVNGGVVGNGARVILYTYHSGNNQQWIIYKKNN